MIAWTAIDLLKGRVVRLTQGQESRRTDFGAATDVFDAHVSNGLRRFHVVDLGAAFGREPSLPGFLRAVAGRKRGVRLQVAGGIRSIAAARRLFDLGAARVVVGSLIFRDPATCGRLVEKFGPGKCVAALDFRNGHVRIDGWKTGIGTTRAGIRAAVDLGFAEALVTDIGRDGMLLGPNFPALRRLAGCGLRIIASGGISSLRHLRSLAAMSHVSGAVVGKALYLGRLRPGELREYAS